VIDVAFTRSELRRADVTVVIDVLRATSTATQALAAGYRTVLCAQTIEVARELRGPRRVLAGERHCVKPAGFDQGNSPTEALARRGDELVLATTNGAPTIVAAAQLARQVLLACLLNLEAVVTALQPSEHGPDRDVQIACSGTDGAVALEDVYVAGRLSAALPGERTDAARVAEATASAFDTPFDALSASADAVALRAAGLGDEIEYCAVESELDVVPVVTAAGAGMAAVSDLHTVFPSRLGHVSLDRYEPGIGTPGHVGTSLSVPVTSRLPGMSAAGTSSLSSRTPVAPENVNCGCTVTV
jgi:2-phosphosulfolactate phosphatase